MKTCERCSGSFTAHGLKRHAGRCSPERDREIVRLYEENGIILISRKLGIARGVVQRVLARQGVEMRPRGRVERAPKSEPEKVSGKRHETFTNRCERCYGLILKDEAHECPPWMCK